jgi:hypothetical protein
MSTYAMPPEVEQALERDRCNAWLKGWLEGMLEGRVIGARSLLLKQLDLRFGELPAAAVTRIERAEVPELDQWAGRFVTAAQLEDVIGPTPA